MYAIEIRMKRLTLTLVGESKTFVKTFSGGLVALYESIRSQFAKSCCQNLIAISLWKNRFSNVSSIMVE